MSDVTLIPVSVIALVEDQVSSSPIVLLHDQQANRLLPIWIGDPEARAIAIVLNNTVMPRPLTHKLLFNTVEQMGGKMSRVVIDRLKNNTYFASIYIEMAGKQITIDSRPSDAVAVALEARIPIFVAKNIMDRAAQPNPFFQEKSAGLKKTAKTLFGPEDLEKMKELIEKAREREEKS